MTLEASRAVIQPFFLERPRLGELLLRKGLITAEHLEKALADSRTSGDLLGRVLIRQGYVFDNDLARTLAEQLQLPYVDLQVLGVDVQVARRVPCEAGRRVAAIPVAEVGDRVRVAFADPTDETSRATIQQYIPVFEAAVGELSGIEFVWQQVERLLGVNRSR